ncbi:MAG TPA: tyrosine-protein phosphatase [Acidimicrobiales bacterium]|nr:tyrosine-protein phosphatase [Acidimicrobiales bacterium]
MSATITDLTVEGVGDGDLTVRWRSVGDPVPVEVSVGPTPDAIDHAAPVARVDDGTEVRLTGLEPGRHYVAVAPAAGGPAVVAAERQVALEGALNFRDLGGYRAAGGATTRWGRVFRSDALGGLTVADAALLHRMGLRVVYDLRRDVERQRAPSALPVDGSVRSVVLAIGGDAGEGRELIDQLLAGELDELGIGFMVDLYEQMVDEAAPSFASLLTRLTDAEGLPALFHCTAGKDRTGVSAALLLAVLGVDEGDILDDYELSTVLRSNRRVEELRPRLEAVGVDVERVRPFLSAPRPALRAALDRVDDHHGGVERYLVEGGGMAPTTLDRLRDLLLT